MGCILDLRYSNSDPKVLSKVALEAVCYQTKVYLKQWKVGLKVKPEESILRIDGGMVASDWMIQNLADILNSPIDRSTILETTALGAAWLAESKSGIWPDMDSFLNSC